MIETHTVNALLLPREGGGLLRAALTFVNGLVAPAFLFCAGLGFAISLSRRAPDVPPGRALTTTLLKKILFIMLVGYSMHVPVFSMRGMLDLPAAVRSGFFGVDILQVIAVSLLLLLGAALLFRTARGRIVAGWMIAAAVIAAGAVAGSTPAFSGWGDSLPVWINAYFSREMSLFTVVPWAAYPAAGFASGLFFMRGAVAGEEARPIRAMALPAGAALAGGTVIGFLTLPHYGGDAFWYWSAEYVVVRLGTVILVMCGVWLAVRGGTGPVGRAAGLFGRESLPVYYWHLIIVYGKDFEWSFVRLFPEGMGTAACAAVAAGLIVVMYLFARGWNSVKKSHPRTTEWIVKGTVAGSIVTFLLS